MNRCWAPGPGLWTVGVLALLVYLVIDFAVFPLQTRFPDEERFIGEAVTFAQRGEFWIDRDRAWEMPLTGVLYGVLYKLTGSEGGLIAAARVVQALLLVIQAWLCADLARRLFPSPLVAPLAFVGVLVYPMFVVFQSLLLSEALFNFLLVTGIWCLYRWIDGGQRWGWLIVYAIVIAAATYTKASLTWLPVILPVLLLAALLRWRQAAIAFAVTAIVYALCLSPWWIRNYLLLGEPVWFTTSAASNLYLGNNRANVTAGNDWNTDVERSFVAETDPLPEVERDRRYRERALEYISAEPQRFVTDAVRKLLRLWNVLPNHPDHRQGAYQWIVAASYGPALALALCACWIYRARWRLLLPIYALVTYLTLVHVVTIASLRYRFPLEAFLIVFAAGAIAYFLQGRRLVDVTPGLSRGA